MPTFQGAANTIKQCQSYCKALTILKGPSSLVLAVFIFNEKYHSPVTFKFFRPSDAKRVHQFFCNQKLFSHTISDKVELHELVLCMLVQKLDKGTFQCLVNILDLQEAESAIKKNREIQLGKC